MINTCDDYEHPLISKTFLIYLLRWIVSGIVMLPVVELLSLYVPLWANILLAQVFGACIFYYIDKKIFS